MSNDDLQNMNVIGQAIIDFFNVKVATATAQVFSFRNVVTFRVHQKTCFQGSFHADLESELQIIISLIDVIDAID